MAVIQLQSIQENESTHTKSTQHGGRCLTPFQKSLLESKLTEELPPKYEQRIRIMLMADDGINQSKIAKALGCSPLTVRHWTFVAQSGDAHNWQQRGLGRPTIANQEYKERLAELVRNSPRDVQVPNRDYSYRQHRWTAALLSKHLQAEFGVEVSNRHINRLLKGMGLSTRPRDKYKEQNDLSQFENGRICIQDLSQSSQQNPDHLPIWNLGLLNINESGRLDGESSTLTSISA